MSQSRVDSEKLIEFLTRLGARFRQPGTVYLVGGSSLLLVEAKKSTYDIDLKFEVAVEYHTEFLNCLRQIRREMDIDVEEASPDQFLPLPGGYEDRRRFVGRYGVLDVFHFDFYSVALGKIQRGNDKDYTDVFNMIRAGVIEFDMLEQYFNEVLPKMEAHSLRADPDKFKRKFELLKQRASERKE